MPISRNLKSGLPEKRPEKGPHYSPADQETMLRALEELAALEDEQLRESETSLYDPDDETLQEVAEQTNYGAVFLNDLIRRQRALSLSVAGTFLIIILSFPLLNFFLQSLVAFKIFGFEISWLFLGILVYPLIWGLAFYFVTTADKYEEEFTRLVK